MFLEVVEAKYVGDYKLELRFNNGELRMADLSESLNGEVFEPLKDKEYFRRFKIKFNTIEWDNGADFAPEYLHDISVPVDVKDLEYC